MSRPSADPTAVRLRVALEMYDVGEGLLRQRLRREAPNATGEQIDERVLEWLHHRPGAEFGDHPGPLSARRP